MAPLGEFVPSARATARLSGSGSADDDAAALIFADASLLRRTRTSRHLASVSSRETETTNYFRERVGHAEATCRQDNEVTTCPSKSPNHAPNFKFGDLEGRYDGRYANVSRDAHGAERRESPVGRHISLAGLTSRTSKEPACPESTARSARGTHARLCTRDGPATRRRRRSTATAGDGGRWRATAGDGAGSGVSRWPAAPCRGRASGLRPCPAAIAMRCTSRRPSAKRRTRPDGRARNGPDGNGISGSRRRHSVDSHGRSSNYPSLLKPGAAAAAAAAAVRHPRGLPSA